MHTTIHQHHPYPCLVISHHHHNHHTTPPPPPPPHQHHLPPHPPHHHNTTTTTTSTTTHHPHSIDFIHTPTQHTHPPCTPSQRIKLPLQHQSKIFINNHYIFAFFQHHHNPKKSIHLATISSIAVNETILAYWL